MEHTVDCEFAQSESLAMDKPRFFATAAHFRRWLQMHHANTRELLVGFHKVDSGRPSIDWPQSVDEALCFGWVDGIRRRIDDTSYTIRFTPRRGSSSWSAVNIRKAEDLIRTGRMQPAGAAAFAARRHNRTGVYSYEQRPETLPDPYASLLLKNRRAATFFTGQPASYRRAAIWWVVSAKQESTRLRRAATLIRSSAAGERIPQFTPRMPSNEI